MYLIVGVYYVFTFIGYSITLYYPLCVSRIIDTWQIVYLSYEDPCPKISIHKSEIIKVH